jgi:hypothetical protein
VKACVDDAQEDRVVITQHGRPPAELMGVEGEDWESDVLQSNLSFWKSVRARRKVPTISLAELKSRYNARDSLHSTHGAAIL